MSAQAGKPVGTVTPVYVSIANGTETPRTLVPSQIFALDDSGNRIAPIPPGEAGRQAGGATALKGALIGGATHGLAAGALAAGLGAAAGALFGNAASGAALGGAIGGGSGLVGGAFAGEQQARDQATQQITAISLQPGEVRRDFTASGYVFFPKGNYSTIEFLMVNGETGDTEEFRTPWH